MNLFGLEHLRFRYRSLRKKAHPPEYAKGAIRLAAYREAQEMEVTWADKIREEGREEGLKEGKRETLKQFLTKKFGPLPETAISRLEALESLEELDSYLDRVLTAGSLEEMGLGD